MGHRGWNERSVGPGVRETLGVRPSADLPTGLVTLLFSDIEGSTRLAAREPSYLDLLLQHRAILRAAFERHGGIEIGTEGDSFFVAFEHPIEGVLAAVEGQQGLAAHCWPEGSAVRVRIGVHSGEVSIVDGQYEGIEVHKAARVASAAHGEQLVLSSATRDLIAGHLPDGLALRDLGNHRLKDLPQLERLHQVDVPGLRTDFPVHSSFAGTPTNLPPEMTSFVGREVECEGVQVALADARLVTVAGPGGAGKTRLAQRIASTQMGRSSDGVWFIDLSALPPEGDVAAAITRVLGIHDELGRDRLDTLVDACGSRDLLFVLDNCEHLLDAVARVSEALLSHCLNVRLLATSREPLRLSAEHVYRIGPLTLPGPDSTAAEAVLECAAAQLFVTRARQRRHRFEVTDGNARTVASICRRLDGMPLAIELAASRVEVLEPEDLLAALDDRFRALRSGIRTASPRQQTLHGLIEWSWQLLEDPRRRILEACSVFPSTFTAESAHAVARGGSTDVWDTADDLEALVAKSLVQPQDHGRYVLLESIRDYAAEKVQQRGGEAAAELRARHRAYFLELARLAEPHLLGPERERLCGDLDVDHDNIDAAIRSSKLDGDPLSGLELLVLLRERWEARGLMPEARELLLDLLDDPRTMDDPSLRGRALADAALHLENGVDGERYRQVSAMARAAAEELGDPWLLSYALSVTGPSIEEVGDHLANAARAVEIARSVGDPFLLSMALTDHWSATGRAEAFDEARAAALELLEIDRRAGHQTRVARILTNLSDLDIRMGRLDEARLRAEEAVAIFESSADARMAPCAWHNLGLVDLLAGQTSLAREAFCRSYQMSRDAGDVGYFPVGIVGVALTYADDARRAAELYGAAESFDPSPSANAATEDQLRDAHLRRLRDALGDEELQAAMERGRSLDRADALALAFEDP